jgi:hypothetical protein
MENYVVLMYLDITMFILQMPHKLYYIYLIKDRRVCVKTCPAPTDTKLDCYMTSDVGCRYKNTTGFQVLKYDNFAYDGGILY